LICEKACTGVFIEGKTIKTTTGTQAQAEKT